MEQSSISLCMYKKKCLHIGPIQEGHHLYKQLRSRCLFSEHVTIIIIIIIIIIMKTINHEIYCYHLLLFFHFKNHPAERKWVEFNSRVNYPIKRALNAMVNEDLINMDDDMNKFCVSWFTSRVADIGIKQVISSWNNHAIPGKIHYHSGDP